jgi:outer membrane protein assembly factor BamB
MYSGPTATPTLDSDSGLLYTLSCDSDLKCWNTKKQGELVWEMNFYDKYKVGQRPHVGGGPRDYGYTTAPLVHDSTLLVAVGGEAGLVVALDKQTGKQRWASENRDFTSNCGGMSPISVDGIACVAVLSLERLVVIRTDQGHEGQTLAEYPWKTIYAQNIVTPTVVGNSVILSSGYNYKKMVLLEIKKDSIVKKWESEHFSAVCSPAVYEDKIYCAYKKLSCLNLEDGSLIWSGGRFEADGSCLVTSDGYVIVYGNKKLIIADSAAGPNDDYREIASRNNVFKKKDAYPHVVFAGFRIYCKDRYGKIKCFDMRANQN